MLAPPSHLRGTFLEMACSRHAAPRARQVGGLAGLDHVALKPEHTCTLSAMFARAEAGLAVNQVRRQAFSVYVRQV